MVRAIMALAGMVALGAVLAPASATFAQQASDRRMPLVGDDSTDPDVQAMFKDLRARGTTPLNLHRIYANAPKLARAQSALAKALRGDAIVPRRDRELIILRATQLAHGDYQHDEHIPIAMSCGISGAQIEAMAHWRDSKLFDEREQAVLAYADAMVSADGIDDATFAAMKRHFTPREIVEITMNAAFYSGSSQVSRALGVTAVGNPPKSGYGTCK
jgi:alkylhydroperoxidase family enzyme